MKDADYRRKTAEAAEVRRAAEAERARIAEERSHYANHLDVVLQSLQTQLVGDQAELAKLAQTNPAEWVAKNAEFQQRYADYQRAVHERQALHGRMTEEQEAQQVEWRKAEREALKTKLPEWNDPAKAADEQRLVAQYLLDMGYQQSELADLFDHRALIVAREAALYRQLQAAKAKKSQPEPRKPIRPGAQPDQNTRQSREADLLKKVQNTGSEEAAVALLLARGNRK